MKKMPLWLTIGLVAGGAYLIYSLTSSGSGTTTPPPPSTPPTPQPPAPTGQAVYTPTGGQQILNSLGL